MSFRLTETVQEQWSHTMMPNMCSDIALQICSLMDMAIGSVDTSRCNAFESVLIGMVYLLALSLSLPFSYSLLQL